MEMTYDPVHREKFPRNGRSCPGRCSNALFTAACIPKVMPELTLLEEVTGKYRAVFAGPEPRRIDAAGPADSNAAFHVPVEREFCFMGNPFFRNFCQNCPHHDLGTADRDPVVRPEVEFVH